MGRNIKTIIKLPTKKVIFEFETEGDWEPQTDLCWTGCPFSVCTSLGQSCLALKQQTCPFARNLTAECDEEWLQFLT